MANLEVSSKRTLSCREGNRLKSGEIPAYGKETARDGKWSRRRSLAFIVTVSVAFWAALGYFVWG